MSSLIKSLAFAGLASEANAMLLKKSCGSGGGTDPVHPGNDMCGLLKMATDAKERKILERDGTDGKNVKYDGTSYDCTPVDTCDPATGTATGKSPANPTVVDTAFTANRIGHFKPPSDDPGLTVVTACTAETAEDQCQLAKALAKKKATAVASSSTSKEINVTFHGETDPKLYKCEPVDHCDTSTGSSGGHSGTMVNPWTNDEINSHNGGTSTNVIAKACTSASATWTQDTTPDVDVCNALYKIKETKYQNKFTGFTYSWTPTNELVELKGTGGPVGPDGTLEVKFQCLSVGNGGNCDVERGQYTTAEPSSTIVKPTVAELDKALAAMGPNKGPLKEGASLKTGTSLVTICNANSSTGATDQTMYSSSSSS